MNNSKLNKSPCNNESLNQRDSKMNIMEQQSSNLMNKYMPLGNSSNLNNNKILKIYNDNPSKGQISNTDQSEL